MVHPFVWKENKYRWNRRLFDFTEKCLCFGSFNRMKQKFFRQKLHKAKTLMEFPEMCEICCDFAASEKKFLRSFGKIHLIFEIWRDEFWDQVAQVIFSKRTYSPTSANTFANYRHITLHGFRPTYQSTKPWIDVYSKSIALKSIELINRNIFGILTPFHSLIQLIDI